MTINKNAWLVKYTGSEYDGVTLGEDLEMDVLLDTGSSYMYLPEETFTAFK